MKIGDLEISKICVGAEEAKIYLGETPVYEKGGGGYVDYIHAENMRGDGGCFLDTGIIPDTSTYFIFNGRYVGYGAWGTIIGYEGNDSNDWRLFKPNSWYADVGDKRYQGILLTSTENEDVEIEFGNFYCRNNLNNRGFSATPYSGSLNTGETILVSLGTIWFNRIRIYTQGNLVYDGRAYKMNGQLGVLDEVSGVFTVPTGFNLVEESAS